MSAKKKSNRESVEGVSKKKGLSLNQRLIKAMAHPLRVQILAYMNDREWSPNELSEELVEGLSQVSYHVKVLRDFEMIEMTKTEPRRGAVEHYYRAMARAIIPLSMAKAIPKSGRRIMIGDVLGEINQDVNASLKSGRFDKRDDYHVSRTPVDLDGQGCEDAHDLADEFVERMLKIEAESAKRRIESKGDPEHIALSAALVVFGSEQGEKEKAPSRKRAKKKKGK